MEGRAVKPRWIAAALGATLANADVQGARNAIGYEPPPAKRWPILAGLWVTVTCASIFVTCIVILIQRT